MQPSREADTVADVLPTIAGPRDLDFTHGHEVLYSSARPTVHGVSKPKPDMLYSASADQVNARAHLALQ